MIIWIRPTNTESFRDQSAHLTCDIIIGRPYVVSHQKVSLIMVSQVGQKASAYYEIGRFVPYRAAAEGLDNLSTVVLEIGTMSPFTIRCAIENHYFIWF